MALLKNRLGEVPSSDDADVLTSPRHRYPRPGEIGLSVRIRESDAVAMPSVGLGTGVADDKSIYPYVPDMIGFYLGEEPILKNVPTWRCREPKDLAYVLDNLGDLVVKEVHGSGGYGMLIGPAATHIKAGIAFAGIAHAWQQLNGF